MRLVVTGGHHTTALAVLQELQKQYPDAEIFWFGHKHSMAGDKNPSAEYQEVTRFFELRRPNKLAKELKKTSAKVKGAFFDLKAGKFYKTYHLLKLLRIPFGFFQAFYWLIKIKPDLVLSFGGYLAVPTVIAAYILRIPSYTHDQTMAPGWANRLISFFAKKIFITWPEASRFFPKNKTILTGNPLRKSIRDLAVGIKPKAKLKLRSAPSANSSLKKTGWPAEKAEKQSFSHSLPIIYITGGKQGSHIINQAVQESLNDFLSDFNIIHQCGSSTIFDDCNKLKQAKNSLTDHLKCRYFVKDYFDESEVAEILSVCDFVVSRAGANTVYELTALGKPAILIPIPWASHNEQYKNAEVLVKAGTAKILEEKNLSSQILTAECRQMRNNLPKYQANSDRAKFLIKLDAAERIVKEITKLNR